MFKRKSMKPVALPYDPLVQKPVIRASICTGEQVAGFKDKTTGKFTEVMLIKSTKDLDEFMACYNIPDTEISKEY
ncbi:MAG: aspartate dehydrogenase [Lachnospiraceae bacterium]|nr:aspartate dehydrogenase [Lachnospiraceae bacterium]